NPEGAEHESGMGRRFGGVFENAAHPLSLKLTVQGTTSFKGADCYQRYLHPGRRSVRALYGILSWPIPQLAATGHLTLCVAELQPNRVPRGWRRRLPANLLDQPCRTPWRSI